MIHVLGLRQIVGFAEWNRAATVRSKYLSRFTELNSEARSKFPSHTRCCQYPGRRLVCTMATTTMRPGLM
ncbi:MAG: hypothetical protein JWM11_7502 [Planctomycetaceae bacterium]|nr:hypothetical protein [Planctomycetaceae bacterium]